MGAKKLGGSKRGRGAKEVKEAKWVLAFQYFALSIAFLKFLRFTNF